MLFGFDVDSPEFVFLIGTGDQGAGFVEIQAIGPAGRLHEDFHFAVDGVSHNPVVGLVGEIDVAVFIHGGAFGKFELGR